MPLFRVVLCTLIIPLACAAREAPERVWKFRDGSSMSGRLNEYLGGLVFLQGSKASRMVHVQHLSEPDLEQVAEFCERLPQTRPTWDTAEEPLPKALRGKLQLLVGDKLAKYPLQGRQVPELFLVYFSAHWCPPCRQYTPSLVSQYKELVARYPGRIELVFVSWDEYESDQLRYAREVGMPWAVLDFAKCRSIPLINQWSPSGIPCLVLMTPQGNAVYHTYQGKEFKGPQSVFDSTKKLMAALYSDRPDKPVAEHAFRVVMYRRSAKGGNLPCKPWLTPFDMAQFQTLKGDVVTVRLQVGPDGTVKSSEVLEKLDPVLRVDIEKVTESWLLLPRIEGGKAVESTVEVPIRLS